MPFPLDTSALTFTLRFDPAAEVVWEVLDGQRQRTDVARADRDGKPLHSYACQVLGAGRDDQVRVKVAGAPPAGASAGATVTFTGLVMGVTNGHQWMRAEGVQVVGQSPWAEA